MGLGREGRQVGEYDILAQWCLTFWPYGPDEWGKTSLWAGLSSVHQDWVVGLSTTPPLPLVLGAGLGAQHCSLLPLCPGTGSSEGRGGWHCPPQLPTLRVGPETWHHPCLALSAGIRCLIQCAGLRAPHSPRIGRGGGGKQCSFAAKCLDLCGAPRTG